MTVESTDRKQTYAGGQDTLTFTFRSLVNHPDYIKVIKTLIATGVDTDLTYGADYTVSLSADGVGGTVTMTPSVSTAYTTTVYRETTDKQESDYDDYNQFSADTIEDDLDRRTLISQEADEEASRTAKLPISSSITDVVLPNPIDGYTMVWSGTGGTLVNSAVPTGSTGATGPQGPAGANGVFSEIASKAEAEAGTENTKGMTPLRTAEAIAALGSTGGVVGVRGVFYNATVTTGSMVITYSSVAFPYTRTVTITNSNGTVCIPDTITLAASSATIDMTSYLPISGTWGTLVI